MKKRTSSMSRRIVSLLMSMVLTLTLVTPAAFATEVVDGSDIAGGAQLTDGEAVGIVFKIIIGAGGGHDGVFEHRAAQLHG